MKEKIALSCVSPLHLPHLPQTSIIKAIRWGLSLMKSLVLSSKLNFSLQFFDSFFFFSTFGNFLILLNLTIVKSPLILWQYSISSVPLDTLTYSKMSHTVDWRSCLSTEERKPTILKHSLLL